MVLVSFARGIQVVCAAGEGIEYSWACAKGSYHRQPHGRKKTKDGFHTLLKECLETGALSIEWARCFLRRAQECMVAYYQLAKDGTSATPTNLKHLNKERKRHRDVTDTSFRWISDVTHHHCI